MINPALDIYQNAIVRLPRESATGPYVRGNLIARPRVRLAMARMEL
jgi:hypothetical protein